MKTKISREFQIFVKPVGPLCNLGCGYCYYLGKKTLYPATERFLMSDDILEKYVIQHIEASTEPEIFFSWHGGEPLIAGIDFFRKVLKLQNIYRRPGSSIINGIQTNGTLLNDELCRLFANEGFIAGISIDGPEEFHNKFRNTSDGSPTFSRVINGYKLLVKYGIIPEILCVVNSENVKHPVVIYNFFKELGAKYITFLPLVEPEKKFPGEVTKNSVPAEEFGFFLATVFDEWVSKDIGKVKVQIIEEAARIAFDQEHTLCIFKKNCGGVPVIEHTGDFYSCDHYVDNENMLGNIRDNSLSYYLDSDRQKTFGLAKSSSLPLYCSECEVLSMCNGECPKNRIIRTPDGEAGLNYLCSGYRYFFNYCRPFVDAIAEAWKNM
jgi:uncharacterized protein